MSQGNAKLRWRLLVTLAAPVLVWAAGYVTLPGVDGQALRGLLGHAPGGAAGMEALSVVALGLTPALTAFALVELVALAVPRWRQIRRGGPSEERRGLRRAALGVTALVALLQGWFVALWLESLGFSFGAYRDVIPQAGLAFRLTAAFTLVGGVFLVVGVAWLAGRYGLLDGFSTLLAAAALPALWHVGRTIYVRAFVQGDSTVMGVLLFVLGMIAMVAATQKLLRTRGPVRMPTSGVLPLGEAAAVLTLPATLASFGFAIDPARSLVPGQSGYEIARALLVLVGCALYTALFHFARRREPDVWRGAARTAVWFGILIGLELVLKRNHVPFAVDLTLVVVATAVALDALDEWRFRARHGELVAVSERHVLADVDEELAKLSAAGVPAVARAAHHRTLLRFFGPFVPVMILVPAERLTDARAVVDPPPAA